MPRIERDKQINVSNKEFNVEDIIVNLSKVPSKEIVDFFNSINLNFERDVRINVLREVFLDSALQTRRERASLADEMNYRLSWFNQFSESQLINLFKFYKDEEITTLYLENLWLGLLGIVVEKRVAEEDLIRLIDLGENYSNIASLEEDIVLYNDNLNVLFYDNKGYIDGLTPEQLRPVLYKSSTMAEIRAIGKKYGVNVPQRLKKAELLEIIFEELKDNGKYTLELEEKLKKMNVILIQRFAFDNDIKASTELKKEEIIEYILKNAEITKESYYIPSDTVYEVEARDVGSSIEEIEEELVDEVEEVEEEVLEEEEIEEEEPEEEILEEPEEELVEELEEEIVEELEDEIEEEEPEEISDEVIEEEVEKEVQVVYRDKPQELLFDVDSIERHVLNIHEFSGKKNKLFKKALKEETNYNEEVTEKEIEKEDKAFELQLDRVSGTRKFFRFIFRFIIFLIVLALLLAIYAVVTEFTGISQSILDIEAKIAGWIKIDLFQTVRDFVRGLYNSVFNK